MNILTMDQAFLISVLIYAAIMAISGILIARKRNWKLGIVRIAVTLAAAIAAIPLARMIAEAATEFVYGLLESELGPDLRAFITAVPIGVAGLRVLVVMVAAPILYLTIFAVLRAIGSFIVGILGRVIPPFKRHPGGILAWSLGAVNGLLIMLVSLIPVCGFMILGARCLGTVVETGMTDSEFVRVNILEPLSITKEDLVTLASDMEDDPVVRVVYGSVGGTVFDYLTSAELDTAGMTDDAATLASTAGGVALRPLSDVPSAASGTVIYMNLEEELCSLLRTTGSVVEAMDRINGEAFAEADKEALYAAADSIFGSDSEWVKLLAGDALTAFAESWKEGESFLGLDRPELEPELDPMLDSILDVLAHETDETLGDDVHTVLDVVGDLLIYDVFSGDVEPSEMVRRLGENGLLTSMLNKLRDNPRLEVLATEVQSLGMRMVSKMLDLDKLKNGEHAEMLDRVADAFNEVLHLDGEERRVAVADAVHKALTDHGYAVDESLALEVADKLIADLGSDGEVTTEELTDYLIDVAEGRVELPDGFEPDIIPEGAV